MNKEKK